MTKDYGEIENNMLLYKSKETIVKDHIELLKRIDKALIKLDDMFNNGDEYTIIDDLIELDKILKGGSSK